MEREKNVIVGRIVILFVLVVLQLFYNATIKKSLTRIETQLGITNEKDFQESLYYNIRVPSKCIEIHTEHIQEWLSE